jgi:hypothetical protein
MGKSSRASPHGEGYVMLYRKSLTSAAFQDEKTWKVWSWCVLRANWQGLPLDYAGEQIVLQRGQFYTGTFSMIGELGMSKSTIWRHLRKLEKWGNVGIETKRAGTVVTVLNYDSYQDPTRSEFVRDGTETGNEREMNGKITGNEREQIRNKEGKEHKEVKPPVVMPENFSSKEAFVVTWLEWEAYRKESGNPLTDRVRKSQWKFLDEQDDPVAVIEQTIRNQWQGLFPLKTNGRKMVSKQKSVSPLMLSEAQRAANS